MIFQVKYFSACICIYLCRRLLLLRHLLRMRSASRLLYSVSVQSNVSRHCCVRRVISSGASLPEFCSYNRFILQWEVQFRHSKPSRKSNISREPRLGACPSLRNCTLGRAGMPSLGNYSRAVSGDYVGLGDLVSAFRIVYLMQNYTDNSY